ncbi:hypothetical protein E2320_012001, partial [Naja naja]
TQALWSGAASLALGEYALSPFVEATLWSWAATRAVRGQRREAELSRAAMAKVWQHPYLNIFKHFKVEEWKRSTKDGDVTTFMLPKTGTQSLGLTGRYIYILFKPAPGKYFVVHLDVATEDSQVVRISFSNLFKEFKSTATWLQFPYICGAARGSGGPCPQQRAMDMLNPGSPPRSRPLPEQNLQSPQKRQAVLQPVALTSSEAHHSKMALHGFSPMPREMAFPVPKGELWHDLYDYIRFPSDGSKMPYDSIQKSTLNSYAAGRPKDEPVTQIPKDVSLSKPMPRQSPLLTKHIPKIHPSRSEPVWTACIADQSLREGSRARGDSCFPPSSMDDGSIHVYAHNNGDDAVCAVTIDSDENQYMPTAGPKTISAKCSVPCTKLLPDPILKLKKIIGFGGCSTKWALWASGSSVVVYPCHALIVAITIDSGKQRFFAGHTDKMGEMSVVRLWDFPSGKCLCVFKTGIHSISCLSFSYSGNVLCGTGKDKRGKTVVVVWNTIQVSRGGEVVMLAKAHTDVDIRAFKIAFFDDTRMVSCGRDNVRLWRIQSGALRSCPVNLGEHRSLEFTDLAFEVGHSTQREPEDRTLFVCSRSGHVLEIDYKNVTVKNVRRLLPVETGAAPQREKQGFNSVSVPLPLMMATCAYGRWTSQKSSWRQHNNPVSSVRISPDNLKVLCTTATGNVGCLDIQSRNYCTIMRSHVGTVLAFSVDSSQKQLATVSEDNTIRIWNVESMQQLYEFTASDEVPCTVAFHPLQPIFACGFNTGVVRTISLAASRLLEEHKQHRGLITGLTFSPDGHFMYSSCTHGTLSLYNCAVQKSHTVRVTALDVALRLCFAPFPLGPLLVSTSSQKILVLDAKSGRLIRMVPQVHRQSCSSLTLSPDGRYVLTAGDRTIKVWDYEMRFDVCCQVFIGHSEPIQQVRFTADQKQVFSVGDAIFLWDFLGVFAEESFRDEADSPGPLVVLQDDPNLENVQNSPPGSSDAPRQLVPLPTVVSPPCLDLSALHRLVEQDTWSDSEEEREACLKGKNAEAVNGTAGHSVLVLNDVQHEGSLPVKPDLTPVCSSPHSPAGGDRGKEMKASLPQNIIRPDCYRHFIPRFFAYSCGCVLIVEDLHSGSQQHWLGHPEEISTLALSHNAQVLASASAQGGGDRRCQICIWNVQNRTCEKILFHHENQVQAMAYSQDDRFLVTLGDYVDRVVALWNSQTYDLVSSTRLAEPVHDLAFNPLSVGQLACVGKGACRHNRLVSGSNAKKIQIWSVAAVQELRVKGSDARSNSVLLEQEITLDGTIVSAAFDDGMDMGIVGTTAGTLWYINWTENTSIRLISGHKNKVSEVAFSPGESHFATCAEDGSVRVWSLASLELSCLCLAWSPVPTSINGLESHHIVAGYSDGTIRLFSISRTEMELKMHPHSVAVRALGYSADGMTIRVLTDHRPSPLTLSSAPENRTLNLGLREAIFGWPPAVIDVSVSGFLTERDPLLQLATETDSLAFLFSLSLSPVACTIAVGFSVACTIAVGFSERMLRLIDCATKTSEDYAGYNDTVCLCRFAPSGKRLFTASYNEILVWEVQSSSAK